MDANEFEKICKQVGAENLFNLLVDAMSSEKMSTERKNLAKLRAMVVTYIMMYSQSQKVKWCNLELVIKA